MTIRGTRLTRLVAVLALVTTAGIAQAGNNFNGTSFRAVGWYKGRSTVSSGTITCEIPTVSSGIQDGAFAMGMWNTYGAQTIFFPDPNQGFANPCGVWMQVQNNLLDQAITIDRVSLRYTIKGAGRFRGVVPTRNGWPLACRGFRRDVLFPGARINPINSDQSSSISGAPNVEFVQLIPTVSPALIACLRNVYGPLPTSTFVSLPLVVTATVFGLSDAGDDLQANSLRYTLNLRHTCGNGRVDDGEQCDPQAPDTCSGFCKIQQGQTVGTCSHDEKRGCRFDADCEGVCFNANQPTECVCVY